MVANKASVRAERSPVKSSEFDRRIAELEDQVKELERLNEAMVGRELKMLEMKKEIKVLKKQIKGGSSR